MKESLRDHLELLFENAPKTRRAFELKEELYTNSAERYDDLINSGVAPEDAFKNVVNSIGNVSELFKGLEEMSAQDLKVADEKVRKQALIRTVAVGLYIFSFVVFLWCLFIGNAYIRHADSFLIGLISMILIDIIPTCLLVYASSAYPKYMRLDNTVVEEFKEWKSETQKLNSVKSAIYIVLWTAVLLLYFAVSFTTFAWNISWIIFLVGACANAIVVLVFRLKEMKK